MQTLIFYSNILLRKDRFISRILF